jgi:hypothetical protein
MGKSNTRTSKKAQCEAAVESVGRGAEYFSFSFSFSFSSSCRIISSCLALALAVAGCFAFGRAASATILLFASTCQRRKLGQRCPHAPLQFSTLFIRFIGYRCFEDCSHKEQGLFANTLTEYERLNPKRLTLARLYKTTSDWLGSFSTLSTTFS